jgi:aspartate carbamoyltransferase catalytic subunit
MAELIAHYIETTGGPFNPGGLPERHWYGIDGEKYPLLVDGVKYAVTGDIGEPGKLLDSEGNALAILDVRGHVVHPAQLRYNPYTCDPAARQRAKDRFEAIASAILECDKEYLAAEQSRGHNANA